MYDKNFDEKLKKRFFNAYKFSKHDNNNVYPYEYMDDWKNIIT